MTDEMRAREKAICKVAGIKDIGDLSDGFHTFNQLYYQRMMLFATIVKQNRDKAWKSLRHEDGELCFGGGWFIVGVDTPEGSYTYHYEDNYYSLFDCAELECGKHWDGHTEKDVTRLLSLPVLEKQEQDRWRPFKCREATEDDYTSFDYIMECELPEDGQTVLVTIQTKGHEPVQVDTYYGGGGEECSLDSGYALCEEAIAWRPLPEPYEPEEES